MTQTARVTCPAKDPLPSDHSWARPIGSAARAICVPVALGVLLATPLARANRFQPYLARQQHSNHGPTHLNRGSVNRTNSNLARNTRNNNIAHLNQRTGLNQQARQTGHSIAQTGRQVGQALKPYQGVAEDYAVGKMHKGLRAPGGIALDAAYGGYKQWKEMHNHGFTKTQVAKGVAKAVGKSGLESAVKTATSSDAVNLGKAVYRGYQHAMADGHTNPKELATEIGKEVLPAAVNAGINHLPFATEAHALADAAPIALNQYREHRASKHHNKKYNQRHAKNKTKKTKTQISAAKIRDQAKRDALEAEAALAKAQGLEHLPSYEKSRARRQQIIANGSHGAGRGHKRRRPHTDAARTGAGDSMSSQLGFRDPNDITTALKEAS